VGAAHHVEEWIHKMAARAVVAVLAARSLHSVEMAELIHLLKHTFHAAREDLIDQLLDGPNEESEEQERKRR
jgi:hypothetical protein